MNSNFQSQMNDIHKKKDQANKIMSSAHIYITIGIILLVIGIAGGITSVVFVILKIASAESGCLMGIGLLFVLLGLPLLIVGVIRRIDAKMFSLEADVESIPFRMMTIAEEENQNKSAKVDK